MPGETPQVSVCIATYNQEEYILDCVMSVLAQRTDIPLEVLVGDDGSTDRTPEILRAITALYPVEVKVFRHNQNLGASANYQYLIERASTPFIAHLDGDDFWLPGKLRKQIAFLRQNPHCTAVYSNAIVINNDNELVGVFNNHLASTYDLIGLVIKGNFLNHSSLIYRMEFKGEILSIQDEFIDYRMLLRLAKNGNIGYLNQALVGYRLSSTTSMIANIPNKVRKLYWEAILDISTTNSIRSIPLAKGIAVFWGSMLRFTIQRFNFREAIRWSAKICRESPVSPRVVFALMLFQELTGLPRRLARKLQNLTFGTQLTVLFRR
jgi:glycosyltransferase involved in cell wall biosynthesis